jgi:hypothetical protein
MDLPMPEDMFAGYLSKIKPVYHTRIKDGNNLRTWIAELDGRLPRRNETLFEAADFINSFDRKAKAKDKGYKFFGMPDEELDILKSLLKTEYNKSAYHDNPTGIANPADYMNKEENE